MFQQQNKALNEGKRIIIREWKRCFRELNKRSSGETADSIEGNVRFDGNGFDLEISANEAIIFIDRGRKAGGKQPPPDAIQKFIRDRNIIPVGISTDSLGFLIGRKIARDGIEPTNILEKIEERSFDKIFKLVSEGTREDVVNETFNQVLEVFR